MERALTVQNNIAELSPEGALQLIRVMEPSVPIRVRGRVTKLNIYREYCYGTIESLQGDGAIRFKCSLDSAPKMEQQIAVMEGALTVKTAYKQNGLDVILDGRYVGAVDLPVGNPTITLLKTRPRSKVSLKRFIDEYGIGDIGIIGTYTGINDINALSNIDNNQFAFVLQQSFSDFPKLIAKVKEKSPKAIIFARGGDDDSINMWDKPEFVNELIQLEIPFYTAIGHAHRLTLADHYADDTFETPSSLGTALRAIFEELDLYRRSLGRLNTTNKLLEDRNLKAINEIKSLKLAVKILMVSVVLIALLVIGFVMMH